MLLHPDTYRGVPISVVPIFRMFRGPAGGRTTSRDSIERDG